MNDYRILLEIGLTFIAVSIPLVFGMVPPNKFYGVKNPKTMSNEEAGYKANAYLGKGLLISRITMLLGDFLLFTFIAGLSYNLIEGISGVLIGVPIAVTFLGLLIYQRKL